MIITILLLPLGHISFTSMVGDGGGGGEWRHRWLNNKMHRRLRSAVLVAVDLKHMITLGSSLPEKNGFGQREVVRRKRIEEKKG
jgi:hypothetical protein